MPLSLGELHEILRISPVFLVSLLLITILTIGSYGFIQLPRKVMNLSTLVGLLVYFYFFPLFAVKIVILLGIFKIFANRLESLMRRASVVPSIYIFCIFLLVYTVTSTLIIFFTNQSASKLEMILVPSILLTLFLKVVYYFFEYRSQRLKDLDLAEFANYLCSLPFVIPNSPLVSPYEYFSSVNKFDSLEQRLKSGTSLLLKLSVYVGLFLLISMYIKGPLKNQYFEFLKIPERVPKILLLLSLSLFYIHYYLYRYIQPQLSVTLCHFLGHRIEANYRSPLLAVSFLDLWNRWNIHSKKFLENVIFFPTFFKVRSVLKGPLRRPLAQLIGVFFVFATSTALVIAHRSIFFFALTGSIANYQIYQRIFVYECIKFILIFIAILLSPRVRKIQVYLPKPLSLIVVTTGTIITFIIRACTLPILLVGEFNSKHLEALWITLFN